MLVSDISLLYIIEDNLSHIFLLNQLNSKLLYFKEKLHLYGQCQI